ncbi:metal ABC transporter permease [Aeromicrobium sp. CTD01-1L150]|uniref:metal ABC transporter permease n=1 Tax=Aeromicrobium sp. CTD01-1L150 TaxID=3341830 RepID=UPI0035C1BEF8
MTDLLGYEFMRLALVAAVFTGLAAPAIGTYLVQRRLALLGDGLGHVALTGVALGLLTGTAPVLTALVVAALGAALIEVLRAFTRTSADLALAMLFYGGIAGGVLLVNLSGEGAAVLNQYLFGAITTVDRSEVWVVAVLGVIVVSTSLLLGPQLFAVCQDEEHARVSGVPVRLYGLLVAVLAAVTITVAMRTVGLLLVSALMVVPVAAAQQLARSFRATHLLAMLIGLLTAVGGVVVSYESDVQPGPTIVMLALGVFAATALTRLATAHLPTAPWLRRRRQVPSA